MQGIALAHPYQEGRSCSKSGKIPPSGLEGDSLMDRLMDDGCTEKYCCSHTPLPCKEKDVASLVEFRPVV